MKGKTSEGEELRVKDEGVQPGGVEVPTGSGKRNLSASGN